MWPDRVSNPGPLTYKSGALPTALRSPANSVINVGGVPVLISAHCLMEFHICTRFHENILNGFRIIEQTRFSYYNFQRSIILSKCR